MQHEHAAFAFDVACCLLLRMPLRFAARPTGFAAGLCASCKQRHVCMQADAKALVRAAEQRLQALDIKNAEILRNTIQYMDTTEKRHSQAEAENQTQHDSDVRYLQARHESAILKFQAEHSFAMQSVKSQHSFAFESSEAQHKSQLQATSAEHAAATLRAQSHHESEVMALRSQIASQLELVAQHSAEYEGSLSQQQAAHSDIVAQFQARHDAEASQLCKRYADAQGQHDSFKLSRQSMKPPLGMSMLGLSLPCLPTEHSSAPCKSPLLSMSLKC